MVLDGLRRIRVKFNGLKLNVKFTLVTILFLLVPITAFSAFLFWNLEQNAIQEKINGMEYIMERRQDQIQKNVETINMFTQFFLTDEALLEFLTDRKQGRQMSVEEVSEFYHKEIAAMERMVNSNLDLYQIRIYVDDDTMQEMMPILYRRDRMNRLSWAQDEELFGWKFNYTDTIFDSYAMNQNDRIMSLVTPIEDYENGELAILEVSMPMKNMFDDLYKIEESTISCVVDEDGNCYLGEAENRENSYMKAVLSSLEKEVAESRFYYDKVDGEDIVVGCLSVRELSSTLIRIQNISADVGRIKHMRNIFVLLMLLSFPLLAVLINAVVKGMLRQLYQILNLMKRIQTGDLDIRIENCGTDEMGELGSQMNKMLEEIRHLMDDNIKRELLAKNSEIKALQNQINAHFIYNVLESIKMMAEIEEKYDISDAITTLGKLLRYSMRWTSQTVTVQEEINYIKNYLTLINLRFDYEIYLSLNMPEIIYKQQIPKMSLQPIVENAIYHGIEQLAEDTSIYIKGLIDGGDCIIEITDAGKGMSEEEVARLYKKIAGEIETTGGSGNGIGLKNVQDRIKMSFGDAYGIEIASKLGCYTKIMVRMPLKRGKE